MIDRDIGVFAAIDVSMTNTITTTTTTNITTIDVSTAANTTTFMTPQSIPVSATNVEPSSILKLEVKLSFDCCLYVD